MDHNETAAGSEPAGNPEATKKETWETPSATIVPVAGVTAHNPGGSSGDGQASCLS